MRTNHFGIAVGGQERLERAIEAQVRAKHQDELSSCTTKSEKAALRKKIQREIEEELKRVASPHSLW